MAGVSEGGGGGGSWMERLPRQFLSSLSFFLSLSPSITDAQHIYECLVSREPVTSLSAVSFSLAFTTLLPPSIFLMG